MKYKVGEIVKLKALSRFDSKKLKIIRDLPSGHAVVKKVNISPIRCMGSYEMWEVDWLVGEYEINKLGRFSIPIEDRFEILDL